MVFPEHFNLRESANLLDEAIEEIRLAIARADSATLEEIFAELVIIEQAADRATRAAFMIESLDDSHHMNALINAKCDPPAPCDE